MKFRNNSQHMKNSDYKIEPTAEELSTNTKPEVNKVGNSISNNLRYGNFYHQLLPFYEVFGDDGMIFLDGTNMGKSQNISVPGRLTARDLRSARTDRVLDLRI